MRRQVNRSIDTSGRRNMTKKSKPPPTTCISFCKHRRLLTKEAAALLLRSFSARGRAKPTTLPKPAQTPSHSEEYRHPHRLRRESSQSKTLPRAIRLCEKSLFSAKQACPNKPATRDQPDSMLYLSRSRFYLQNFEQILNQSKPTTNRKSRHASLILGGCD